ncbi:MAG TPA: hypothetical protein VHW66_15390 [Stellaceae bacterium]|nr:hypothetical protein [Stellaceae bacterium]
MFSFIRGSVLGLGLLAGAAFVAQAQTSDNTAALPPGGGVPSAIAPSGNYPGPAVGGGSISGKPVMGGPVVASGQYPGPALGGGNGAMPPHFAKPTGYDQDRNMAPYSTGYGPKPN